jgi:hypothetical protein
MALFGTRRDSKFVASINMELMNAIIDTEIELFKLVIEESNSNIYGESEKKVYYNSVLVPCVLNRDEKSAGHDDYGHSYTRNATFGITNDIAVKSGIYPEVGDIIFWDNEYFEIDNVDSNQYFTNKNPSTWQNGNTHGYNVSISISAHVTRQTPHNIRDIRFGNDANQHPYTGNA